VGNFFGGNGCDRTCKERQQAHNWCKAQSGCIEELRANTREKFRKRSAQVIQTATEAGQSYYFENGRAHIGDQVSSSGAPVNQNPVVGVSVDEANDILSTAYWVGLRGGFGVNIGIASFHIDLNAISHECDFGKTCDGNSLTQSIVIGGTIRGADVEITLVDISRSTEDSLTWSEFEISGPSINYGPANLGNGSLVIGIEGGFLVGGSVEYDVGKFITEQVFGTCHGGARCQAR